MSGGMPTIALLTMVVSRRLLALVRRRLVAMADRIPEQRWAAVFVSLAHELLPQRSVRSVRCGSCCDTLTRCSCTSVDPNAARHGLLASVEERTHRLHPNGHRGMNCSPNDAQGAHLPITHDCSNNSVLDGFDAKRGESLDVALHGLELFGGVSLPVRDLARDQ